jgi:predicted transcriptional regulator
MEQMNVIFSTYLTVVLALLFVLAVIALVMCFSLSSRLNALQKKYDFFTQGKEANIDEVLTKTLKELNATRAELAELQDKHARLKEQVQNCLQNVKMVRYDAFDAMGGKMSYSLLLTDANNKGIILTSIYGRDESRNFAKDIDNGKSSYVLADEEKQLL